MEKDTANSKETVKKEKVKKSGEKQFRGVKIAVMAAVCVVSVLLCCTIVWLLDTWKHLSMDELVFQIQAPMAGTNKGMILEYMIKCLPLTLVMLGIMIALYFILRKRRQVYKRVLIPITCLSVAALVGFGVYLWQKLDVTEYVHNINTYSDFVDSNYVDPENVNLTFPEKKRNLIYIYLESMETTYSDVEDGGGFTYNCIEELTEIARKNEDFSGDTEALNGGRVLPYCSWTTAGIFSQTTGLPLKTRIDSEWISNQEHFFPEVTALGDLLETEGYKQIYMLGSKAVFGGREMYFKDHGNYEIKDYDYFVENGDIPEDYYVWWGFEDEYLFKFAKEELTRLAGEEEPFNLTLLTVDTHFEDGYVCGLCDDKYGQNQYANVMSCSSRQVAEFVEWIQQQDFYENTTIIISGDHTTMDSDFCDNVSESYVRKTYTAYINAAAEPADPNLRREFTTLDNFPTTLAAMGVEIEGDRLGLGTNLFSETKTLLEEYGYDYMSQEISKESRMMEDLGKDIDDEAAEKAG